MATKTKTKKKVVTNPNGANQYLLDPRQNVCWGFYVDPKSETFSNATASAIKAGYPQVSARQITTEKWFHEKVVRMNMLSKAERNLDEFLDLPSKTQAMGAFGPLFEIRQEKRRGKDGKTKTVNIPMLNKPIMVHNAGLLTLKQRTTEFIAERVGRKRYGTKEVPGGNMYNVIIFADEQRARIAKRIMEGSVRRRPVDNSTG